MAKNNEDIKKEEEEVKVKSAEEKKEESGGKKKNTLVHDAICLFIITLVAGALLGGVYTMTKKPIDKQNETKKQEAYNTVFKGAKFEADKDLNKKLKSFSKDLAAGKIKSDNLGDLSDVEIREILKAKLDGKDAGYVVTCSGKGYGGAVVLALGIDSEGSIKGIQVTSCNDETPGLGQNASKADFYTQYKGTKKDMDLSVVKDGSGSSESGTINAISGATITSSAVTRAVNATFKFISTL